jgi:exoribonuclease-2
VSLQVQEVDTLMMDLRTKFLQVLENEAVVTDVVADDENEVEAA